MNNGRWYIVIALVSAMLLAAWYFIGNLNRKECHTTYIIEAEEMTLSNYQVTNNTSVTYIKLNELRGDTYSVLQIPTGRYNVEVRYLADSIGQNTYTMYIGNNQIVAWLGKSRDEKWHLLSEQKWHSPRNIEINRGDTLLIEGLSENGSSVAIDYISFSKSTIKETKLKSLQKQTPKITSTEPIDVQLDLVVIKPEEYMAAIKNPLKGFRGSDLRHQYSSLIKKYIKWRDIEDVESDGLEKIVDYCNKTWVGYREQNIKVIPRVYLDWPKQKNSWPSDMPNQDYTSDQFQMRVVAMIKKIGQVWDNDPRVAYVEMGLIGYWGEMEFPDTRDDIKESIAEAFSSSFKNKLVMIRWPNTYSDNLYNFGYYWDSFAHIDQAYYQYNLQNSARKWETSVLGGECAYDWGNIDIQPGTSPDISLSTPKHRDYIVSTIRRLHANHVGWISKYNQDDKDVSIGAEIIQKTLGYRFVINEVKYSKKIESNNNLYISLSVVNTGSSPFYYNWPIEASLLNPTTKQVVWKDEFKGVDIRDWLPGDNWSDSKSTYTTPAKKYFIEQIFHLPNISSGEYILALSILDPASKMPSARFAIANYYKGGRHPIGKVDKGKGLESFYISDFDDLQTDNTLYY